MAPAPERAELHGSIEAHDPTAKETRLQVQQALADLPEGQRTVIALHWLDGLSFREVAEVIDASLSAVKVRAHRGYKALKSSLEASDAPSSIRVSTGSGGVL